MTRYNTLLPPLLSIPETHSAIMTAGNAILANPDGVHPDVAEYAAFHLSQLQEKLDAIKEDSTRMPLTEVPLIDMYVLLSDVDTQISENLGMMSVMNAGYPFHEAKAETDALVYIRREVLESACVVRITSSVLN